MPDAGPTVGELFKAKAATDDQVNAAVEAYVAGSVTTAYPIADGDSLDLTAAVAVHPWANRTVPSKTMNRAPA